MIEVLAAAAAFLVGTALGWALARSSRAIVGLREDNAGLRAELTHLQQAVPRQLALLDEARTELKASFDSLAGAALRSSTEEFLKLADQKLGNVQRDALGELGRRQQALDELIAPIRETLAQVDRRIGETDVARAQTGAEIATLLKGVQQEQDRLREETQQLVRALRTPSVRGRWGEIQLRRVVELAGMLEYCDFDEQPTLLAEFGRQRPDLIVRLPGGRTIVVDAKVPLDGYLDAQATDDDDTRRERMGAHARQVREHMTRLGAKSYWEQVQPSPEFVVMFLPGESLFHAALQQDASLVDYGVRTQVYPASPITLIALLQVVAQGWRHERLAQNAEEIQALGQELHARVAKMTEYLDTLRTRLDSTVRAFNDVVGSYETRVLVTARRFKTLGAASGGEIDPLQAIDSVPRVMQSANLLGLPEETIVEGEAVEEKT
jgi:DNA recombination protein RmuC